MDTLEFDTPKAILERHPNDKRFPPDDTGQEPTPGRGFIGAAVTFSDESRCISIFIGAGNAVLISSSGEYLGFECADDPNIIRHVSNGAWLPETLYYKALRDNP